MTEREPKILKLERGQSGSKVSFDDTMDVVKLVAGRPVEPDSSEEDNEVDNRSGRFLWSFSRNEKRKTLLKGIGWRYFRPRLPSVQTLPLTAGKCLPRVNQSRLATPCQSR